MKKLLTAILILFCSLQAYAFEDYFIMSDKPVKNVYSKDENIVSVLPFFTIDNSKNTMILKSKSEGLTEIVIETEDETINIKVEVNEKDTTFSKNNGISVFSVDFFFFFVKPKLREEK